VEVVVAEAQVYPAGHWEHSVWLVRLVESEYVPTGHAYVLGFTVPGGQKYPREQGTAIVVMAENGQA